MEQKNIIIRPAVTGDTPGIVMLVNDIGYPTEGPEMLMRVNKLTNHPDYMLRVACIRDEVIGLVAFQHCLAVHTSGTLIRMLALVVSRRHRNKGIGGMLLREADKEAIHAGAEAILFNFELYPDLKDARDFCQKKGYVPRAMALLKKFPWPPRIF